MSRICKKMISICCILTLVCALIPSPRFAFAETDANEKPDALATEEVTENLTGSITYTFDPYDFSTQYDVISLFAFYDLYQGSFGSELSEAQKKYYNLLVDTYVDSETGLAKTASDSMSVTLNDSVEFPVDAGGNLLSDGNDRASVLTEDVWYGFFAFTRDYPQVFWARKIGVSLRWTYNTGTLKGHFTSMDLTVYEGYLGAASQITAYNAGLSDAVSQIKTDREGTDQYYTLKEIHDYICEKTTYNHNAVEDPDSHMYAHSSGPVFTEEAPSVVCEGYGMAFKVLCDAFDIPCALITGEGDGGAHLWNYVQLDGKWYGVDVTWDDQSHGIIYSYFLVGSDKMSEKHVPKNNSFDGEGVLTFAFPTLNETKYEYVEKPAYDMSGVAFHGQTFPYDGESKSIFIQGTLPEGVTVSYDNNGKVKAGTYTVTANFNGDTTTYRPIEPQKAILRIEPKSIAQMTAKLSYASCNYNGKAKKPTVSISGLENGTDYTVSYSNNVAVGTAKVTITGKGNYTGMLTKTFAIKKPVITPTNVKAAIYSQYDTIRVSWSKNSAATAYRVYYKKASASKWSSKKTTKTYLVREGLSDGVKYQFKVVPLINNVESSKTKTVSAATLKKLNRPTLKKYSTTKVKASWTKISGATGYQVKQFKSTGKTSKGSSYKTTGSYKVMKAAKKKSFYYRVRSYYKTSSGKYIYGPWSNYRTYKLK